jgi:hypothetical protein
MKRIIATRFTPAEVTNNPQIDEDRKHFAACNPASRLDWSPSRYRIIRDGNAFLSAIATPSEQGRGLDTEGVLLGFHREFPTWPYRKPYLEAADDMKPSE